MYMCSMHTQTINLIDIPTDQWSDSYRLQLHFKTPEWHPSIASFLRLASTLQRKSWRFLWTGEQENNAYLDLIKESGEHDHTKRRPLDQLKSDLTQQHCKPPWDMMWYVRSGAEYKYTFIHSFIHSKRNLVPRVLSTPLSKQEERWTWERDVRGLLQVTNTFFTVRQTKKKNVNEKRTWKSRSCHVLNPSLRSGPPKQNRMNSNLRQGAHENWPSGSYRLRAVCFLINIGKPQLW